MAISQEDILARIQQIQSTGGGDTAATRAQIAQEAQQYGVTAEQIGAATGLLGTQVRQMAEEAGQAFEPLKLAGGGMLGGTPVDMPTAPTVTPRTGMLEGTTVDVTPKPYTPSITTATLDQAYGGNYDAFSDLLLNTYTSGVDTTQYNPYFENIASSISQQTGLDPVSVGATGTALAMLKNEYNKEVAAGNTKKANELNRAINSTTDEMWGYYEQNYPEGSAHKTMQTLFADPFDVGDPGKYTSTLLDKAGKFFTNVGDAFGDVVENPYIQAVVAFIPAIGPQISSIMQLYGKLDSNEPISPATWAAAIAGGVSLAGLEGGAFLDKLPPKMKSTIESMQKAVEGGWDEAVSAFKDAGIDVDTEQLAAWEDATKQFLGEENVQAISEGLAGIDDGFQGLTDIDLSGLGDFLTQEDLTAALAGIQTGSGFTPQRGYQPGLPVDTQFDIDNGSMVAEILNQPSAVRTA